MRQGGMGGSKFIFYTVSHQANDNRYQPTYKEQGKRGEEKIIELRTFDHFGDKKADHKKA